MMVENLIVTSIADLLAARVSWRVLKELKSRARRYDLVATAPDGEKFVIEVKTGEGRAHFGQVAQVEALASELQQEDRSNTPPTPILLTNMDVPNSIHDAAEAAGVEIVRATGSETQMAKALVDYLDHRERRDRPESATRA